MLRTRKLLRTALTGAAALVTATALTGCTQMLERIGVSTEVQPWAVANHDDKTAYHQDAGDTLLNLDTTSGLAALPAFQAVGYHHVESPNSSIHMEYETSAEGESYISRLVTNVEGYSFDQSHREGDPHTYYLLGDEVRKVASDGKSWVSVPLGDLGLRQDPGAVCQLFAVSYTCALVDAWNTTREQLGAVPVELSRAEDGSQHFSTAVSYASLRDGGLVGDDLASFSDAKSADALIPLHLWVDENGLVTKMEANGVIASESGEELALQIGFELTAKEASEQMQPVTPSDIPDNDLLEITTQSQLDEFLTKLAQV